MFFIAWRYNYNEQEEKARRGEEVSIVLITGFHLTVIPL